MITWAQGILGQVFVVVLKCTLRIVEAYLWYKIPSDPACKRRSEPIQEGEGRRETMVYYVCLSL